MKNWRTAFNKNRKTTLFRMSFWYILILLLTVVFIGLAAVTSISYQLYKSTEHEINYVEKQLHKESKEKNPDWTDSLENIFYSQHPDFYVHIETPQHKTIYSKGSESITDNNMYKFKLSLFSSIAFKKKLVPIYHHHFLYNGYTFDLYVRMISIHKFISLMIKVLLVCILLGTVFGALAIYQLSKKLSRPLMEVTSMINQVTETNDLKQRVPVPESPKEVHELALAFNQLMGQLDQQIERELHFVSDASHELRTPLSAIRGHVELIKRHGNDHPELVQKSMHFVDEESKRMQRLINQLLMIARLDRRSKELENVNLSMIAKNVVLDYATDVKQHFSTEITDATYALANEDYVHQVMVSLLGNARKYTPEDGWIKLIINRDEHYSYIIVQNSGSSIPDDEKEKIFTRFYRLDKSRTSENGGSGLGLAIVKELVELDEGSIWVEDVEPTGSAFIVRLKSRTANSLK
ncbi:sensor histidine kinase [Sporolactobacillus kofuensis]|uniref:histidine kinase n=1 Tax=Sporolactobacillus kofuensis TaxID=269672 RepID=A0ABW1WCF2_9BACL|nr:HAMP domain-containing sensor histidine kinase [Sporolactobacillus kofuensis]MCO7174950.1 HAMP domain-containing histidine kinase [Sporolactobacillus kofuensis]